jgi:hypothetical protein
MTRREAGERQAESLGLMRICEEFTTSPLDFKEKGYRLFL